MKSYFYTIAKAVKNARDFDTDFRDNYDIADTEGKFYHYFWGYYVSDKTFRACVNKIKDSLGFYNDDDLLDELEEILNKGFDGSILRDRWFDEDYPEHTPLNNMIVVSLNYDFSHKGIAYIAMVEA